MYQPYFYYLSSFQYRFNRFKPRIISDGLRFPPGLPSPSSPLSASPPQVSESAPDFRTPVSFLSAYVFVRRLHWHPRNVPSSDRPLRGGLPRVPSRRRLHNLLREGVGQRPHLPKARRKTLLGPGQLEADGRFRSFLGGLAGVRPALGVQRVVYAVVRGRAQYQTSATEGGSGFDNTHADDVLTPIFYVRRNGSGEGRNADERLGKIYGTRR